MTSILGISAFYHDSAAALIIDGKIIAAAQEERFSRKKHDARYPFHAVEYILKEFFDFVRERKKYWLFPILIVLVLFGILIVLSQGSAIAPFIYTIF